MKPHVPAAAPPKLLRSTLPVRVTREGKLFLLLAAGVGFAAVNTGNNLLYLVLALQISLVALQLLLGEFNVRNIQVTRDAPKRAAAEQIFPVTLQVTNLNRYFPIFSVQLRDIINNQPFKRSGYFLKTDAGETRTIAYRGEFPTRGAQHFTHIKVSSEFPFGLTRRTKWLALPHQMIIWPAHIPVRIPPAFRHPGWRRQSVSQKGVGDEYWQLRAFHEGDDIKRISWKTSAKMNQLMVIDTQSQTDRQLDVSLLFPENETSRSEDTERLIQIAAGILQALYQQGVTTRLYTPTARGIPGPPQSHWAQLDHLAVLDIRSAARVPAHRHPAHALRIHTSMAQPTGRSSDASPTRERSA
ncbi:MAG: DUF58 domain-containing protein [Deltaproteobacteria bacterium]|nr:DUF58 domain-containing protein [Deltaproteobacteria bacterium]MBN2670836.1 DUF58 domain-containing protein [Deltaproteobacteria bacterium]